VRLLTLLLAFAAAPLVHAQTAPAFEVAAIKPNNSGPGSSGWHSSQGLVRLNNQSLRSLISIAYDVGPAQIVGGPKWIEDDRFDITAKPAGPASEAELRLMLRTLVAERFDLKFHREPRQFSGFALVVAKGGVKMAKSEGEGSSSHGSRGSLTAKGMHMARLAEILTNRLSTPVIDATGLADGYDLKIEWAPDDAATQAGLPTLFTALQEGLGLRLESRKVTLDAIVVDSAEKPTGN